MQSIGDNLDFDEYGTLIFDPSQIVSRSEERPNTVLVASTRGWTGWISTPAGKFKFSVNIVRQK